jgi:hypothetical protein
MEESEAADIWWDGYWTALFIVCGLNALVFLLLIAEGVK